MMEMQGNATEIDERNLLQLDALLSHGYGLSPQLVMRSKGLSIEAKALYGYLSSFAGAGDTAFPSTSRILEELDISKNRFYKIRKELISWGFISIETTATSAGLRTVYTLPQNPIAIKTEIDEIANRRNEIKSSLVANLHNEDMVSHKGDSESERLQQSAGNEPCRQSEAKAQNRGSNLKPCLQSEDEGCLQSGDELYIDTNINPTASLSSTIAAIHRTAPSRRTRSLSAPLSASNHPCFLLAPPRKRGFFTSKRMVLWYNPTTLKRPTYKRGK